MRIIEADVVAMIRKLASLKKAGEDWKKIVEGLLTRGDIRDCFDYVRDQMHEEADALRDDLYDLYYMFHGCPAIDAGPDGDLNRLTNEHNFKGWIDLLREKQR